MWYQILFITTALLGGLILGLALGLLIDTLFWRRQDRRAELLHADLRRSQQQLAQTKQKLSELQDSYDTHHHHTENRLSELLDAVASGRERAQERIAALQEELEESKSGGLVGTVSEREWKLSREVMNLRAELVAVKSRHAAQIALTELRGIGPKFAERLRAAGIDSLEALVRQTPDRLRELVRARPFQRIDPADWIAQATERLGSGGVATSGSEGKALPEERPVAPDQPDRGDGSNSGH